MFRDLTRLLSEFKAARKLKLKKKKIWESSSMRSRWLSSSVAHRTVSQGRDPCACRHTDWEHSRRLGCGKEAIFIPNQ